MPFRKLPFPVIVGSSAASAVSDLDSLYRQHRPLIVRHIEHRFGVGPPDPEDAVQAAFERFANLEDRSQVEDPGAFLRQTARNFVLDHHRAQKVRTAHASLEYDIGTRTDDLDAERVLSSKERLAILDRVIRAMDPRRRDVLVMNRIQGLSCAEIARRLGCSQTLVKMRLAEAVAVCQRALRDADDTA